MTDNDRPYAAKSDEELAAMEHDKSLPIDVWMAVEAERGRRAKGAPREAVPRVVASAPAAAPAASASADDVNVTSGLTELNGLLVPGERLVAYAVQRRLFALSHRRLIVGATTGRFISLSRGLIGGYTPFDVRWQDLAAVSIRAGIFGADLTIATLASDDVGTRERAAGRWTFMGLRKHEAQQVYKICQAQEQQWREKRRVRELDELRAESGGINLGGMPMGGGAAPSAPTSGEPMDRLRRAKEMLDSGLITDAEFDTIKARIVDGL